MFKCHSSVCAKFSVIQYLYFCCTDGQIRMVILYPSPLVILIYGSFLLCVCRNILLWGNAGHGNTVDSWWLPVVRLLVTGEASALRVCICLLNRWLVHDSKKTLLESSLITDTLTLGPSVRRQRHKWKENNILHRVGRTFQILGAGLPTGWGGVRAPSNSPTTPVVDLSICDSHTKYVNNKEPITTFSLLDAKRGCYFICFSTWSLLGLYSLTLTWSQLKQKTEKNRHTLRMISLKYYSLVSYQVSNLLW